MYELQSSQNFQDNFEKNKTGGIPLPQLTFNNKISRALLCWNKLYITCISIFIITESVELSVKIYSYIMKANFMTEEPAACD